MAKGTPISIILSEMANKEKSFDTAAEMVCMVTTVKAMEKHVCGYCKAAGHKRNLCPVHVRLRSKFRGDREINKLRGKRSSAMVRGGRKTPRAIRKNNIR